MMKLEVKGHSGCQIDVVREDGKLYVYKSTRDLGYLNRLCLQGKKQQEAANLGLQHIRVPRIFNISRGDESVSIKMEYVYSKSFVGYFEYAGFEQISYFVDALRLFLDYEINNSKSELIEAEVLRQKFYDVKKKTLNNQSLVGDEEIVNILNESEKHFTEAKDMMLPVGKCHGDLTFSNIMFNGNNYYLIDFLDSFIESPLLDIVKIRQDSAYLWSQLMYSGECDSIRLKIVADKIDKEIVNYASQYEWFKHYGLFQLMNFLRILQYAKERKVIDYLKQVINQLLYEF